MTLSHLAIPEGTRDFSTKDTHRRLTTLQTIRQQLYHYGFQPIDTPILQLVNRNQSIAEQYTIDNSELALPNDLTLPLTNYIKRHYKEFQTPFKCFQMQPIWRKNATPYQEILHCNIDIFGSNSKLVEAEVIYICYQILHYLQLKQLRIRLNDIALLAAKNKQILAKQSLATISNYCEQLGIAANQISCETSLVNQFDYYTSTIFELQFYHNKQWLTLCRGGRYCTPQTYSNHPFYHAVGASFEFEQLLQLVQNTDNINAHTPDTQNLLCVLDDKQLLPTMALLTKLNDAKLYAEMYYQNWDLASMRNYAKAHNIPFLIYIDPDNKQQVRVESQHSGKVKLLEMKQLLPFLSNYVFHKVAS